MHTITMDRKFSSPAMHPSALPVFGMPSLPDSGSLPPSLQIPGTHVTASAGGGMDKQKANAEMAGLDVLLSNEPGLGVFQGLKLAMLFNAGIVLTGMVAWECWALLAS